MRSSATSTRRTRPSSSTRRATTGWSGTTAEDADVGRIDDNLALVRRFWDDLYAHEFDRLGAYFTPEAVYDDVPIPAAQVVGPAAIVRKLRIGFARVLRHTHHLHRMVADETTV